MPLRTRPILSLCLIVFSAPALALNIIVTRLDDPAPDVCLPGDCSLREAVQLANSSSGLDQIRLPASALPYQLSRAGTGENLALNGDLDVSEDLDVIGAGVADSVIEQSAADRVFEVRDDATLTLRALTVTGGRVGASNSGFGGAVLVTFGALEASDAVFSDNRASFSGGAIFIDNTGVAADERLRLGLWRVRFDNNTSGSEGGAIASYSFGQHKASIWDSVFEGNAAEQLGGAIFATGSVASPARLSISRSAFRDNATSSGGVGGAIHAEGAQIFYSRFERNESADGGAVAFAARIWESIFLDNHAERGGALITQEDVSISNSTFCDNVATQSGGAVYGQRLRITTSTFCRNLAVPDAPIPPDSGGGAVHLKDLGGSEPTSLIIERSTFDANVAVLGGTIRQESGYLRLVHSTLVASDSPPSGSSGSLLRYDGNDNDANSLNINDNILRGSCHFAQGPDTVDTAYYNLAAAGQGGNCFDYGGIATAGNVLYANPASIQLDPLADNGGPTQTRRPSTTTPTNAAIDLVAETSCSILDQRGYPVSPGNCDAGAVEIEDLFNDGFE